MRAYKAECELYSDRVRFPCGRGVTELALGESLGFLGPVRKFQESIFKYFNSRKPESDSEVCVS